MLKFAPLFINTLIVYLLKYFLIFTYLWYNIKKILLLASFYMLLMVEDGDLETYVGMLYLSISIIIDVENL